MNKSGVETVLVLVLQSTLGENAFMEPDMKTNISAYLLLCTPDSIVCTVSACMATNIRSVSP